MNGINHHRENRTGTITDQSVEMPNGLIFRHLQVEAVQNLQDRFIWLHPDIRDIRIDHQAEEIEDQVAGFPEGGVRCEAVLLELGVVGRVGSAHTLDHFFAKLHHGSEGLGVAAEYVTEVGVEEMTYGGISSTVGK